MRQAGLLGLVLVLLAPFAARALPEHTWVVAIGHNEGARNEVSLRIPAARRDGTSPGGKA